MCFNIICFVCITKNGLKDTLNKYKNQTRGVLTDFIPRSGIMSSTTLSSTFADDIIWDTFFLRVDYFVFLAALRLRRKLRKHFIPPDTRDFLLSCFSVVIEPNIFSWFSKEILLLLVLFPINSSVSSSVS